MADFRGQMAASQQRNQQQMAKLRELRRAREEAFKRRLAQIERLPHEERRAALDELKRELDEEIRESRDQEMIDTQRDLADAIRELSDEMEQNRY